MAASLLGTGLGLSAPASAAIVVASSGPSAAQYPAGRKLDDGSRITLQKGDSVTVLDKRGTKVLRGPGRVAVGQPGRAVTNPAFAVLTRRDAASRARTGAVRTGDAEKAMSPNLWLIDPARPGTQCIAAPEALGVWRADSAKAARYHILSQGSATGSVAFDADAAIAPWDTAKAPVSDGAVYTLAPESGAPGTFKFVVLADPPADPEALALVLIEKGCAAQLELLAKTLSSTGAS